MIAGLTEQAVARPVVTIALAAALAALGAAAFFQLKLEAYPDLSETQAVIVTLYPGHAPEEIEQQVTIPLERVLNGVPQVASRRARTIFGLSLVELTFESGVEQHTARQMVLEKLRAAELPEGVTPELAPPVTPAGELYRYIVEGPPGYGEMQLRELQDWVIAPRLMQAPGVGDAFAFGGLVKQYQIEADPLALYKYGLTIGKVAEAVARNNQNAGGALLPSGEEALVVRGVGLVKSVADIENIVIAAAHGTPVFVRDIGRVRLGAAPPTGIFGINQQPRAVEGIVAMRRGENASEVLKGIREAVDELNGGRLPPGVRMTPIYDRTDLVNNTLRTVSRTLVEGLAVVLLVLVFFMVSLRAALLTALTIPFSLLCAFGAMYLAGIPANLLSLGAIDFGIIVDGTLVMVEYVVRRVGREAAGGAGNREVVQRAAYAIQRPVFFSLVILIAAYLPLFLLQRVEQKLFAPMAFTICAALAGSMLSALTLTPVLAVYAFPPGWRPRQNPLISYMVKLYTRVVRGLLRRPWGVALATVVVLAAGGWATARLGSEFLPQLDEGVIWARAFLPAGISLEKSAEVAGEVRRLALQSPEVKMVTSQTGRQDSNTEPFGPSRNEILIVLAPYDTWPAGKRKADLVRELSARFREHIPGAAFSFTQPIIDMVMDSLTGSASDLAVIVSGPDLDVLRKTVRQVEPLLAGIPGAADTGIEQEGDAPQLRIDVDRWEAARHGVNVADVQDVIEQAIGGKPVTTFYEGDRRFDVVVRYAPAARSSAGEIGKALVPAPDGGRVPLERLAAIRVASGASIIARRDNRRMMSVRTNIRGRDQGGFVAEAQRRFAAEVKLPPGYRVEWGGQFENLSRARRRLAWVLPLTVVVICGLLYWAFGSLRHTAIVLLNVPFSILGGVLALAWRGIPFSVSAAVGFVSLFGVAVMSGVLYVAETNQQRAQSRLPLLEAVLAGAEAQVRARSMLTVVAMLGMAPAALATGIGSDIQRPLATVVIGGLASTLVLTLLALPVLYYLAERRRAVQA